MKKIVPLLVEMEEAIPLAAKKSALVSQANVGWHIEHSLLVIDKIIEAMKKSDPALYRWKFSMAWLFVSGVGTIARGRGKAPASVLPTGVSEIATLRKELNKVKERVKLLDTLPANSFFKHPYFGHMNVKTARKFLAIHTEHHLKIIREIINS